mgnify:CR=1 FL=1
MEINFTVDTKDVLLGMISKHNSLYRAGKPEILDLEYDTLVNKLREIDPENDWFKNTEPVNVPDNRKVSLPIPMKSLNKVKDMGELSKWFKSLSLTEETQIICMPKFDGIALLHDEIKDRSYSRGGADNEGQDCSEHFRKAGFSSRKNNSLFTFGELLFSNKDWEEHFKNKKSIHSGDPFKSPRNTVAGLINRDEPSPYLKSTSFYRYGIDAGSLNQFNTYEEVIAELCKQYKQPVLYTKVSIKNLNDSFLIELFTAWKEMYPIDGIVLYINNLDIWETLGRHQTTGNPLYAIAYKHPDFTEMFVTTVKDISWKVSKSGALKPVVNIELVDTGDCNMENPTGYNAGWINDMEIAQNAKVLVTRSGGVIPKILKTIVPASENEQNKLWDHLAECPHCGFPTAWNSSSIELCCTNQTCPGKILAKIVFFFDTCGSENMGEETLSKIYNSGFKSVKAILDISFDELMGIEGFGEATSNIVLENVRKIKQGLDMATFMHASDCFEGIGKVKAQKILDNMEKNDQLCSFYQGWFTLPSEEYICNQSKTMQSFYKGVMPFYKFMNETGIQVLPLSKKEVKANGACAGMVVCFSGIRDAKMEEQIVNEGGKIVNSVSKNTTLLIVKDKNLSSSKISKAKSMNIKILNIEEFNYMQED